MGAQRSYVPEHALSICKIGILMIRKLIYRWPLERCVCQFFWLLQLPDIVQHGPEFSAEKTWLQLSQNICEIQKQNASNLSFEENHRFAYNMVLNKEGEMLYKGVKKLVSDNLDSMANERIIPFFPSGTADALVRSTEDSVLLDKVKRVWEEHGSNMVRLGQILKYMASFHLYFLFHSP